MPVPFTRPLVHTPGVEPGSRWLSTSEVCLFPSRVRVWWAARESNPPLFLVLSEVPLPRGLAAQDQKDQRLRRWQREIVLLNTADVSAEPIL